MTTLEDNLLPVPLGKEELHRLAMNIIGKDLEKDNYEFLSINSSLEKNPQFVCTKNKQLYFIIVKAILYPENPKTFEIKNLNKILDHCTKFDAKLLCAKVGLANSDDYELPLFKNSSYIINYEGIEKIN
ncbi:Na(+)-translocating NADH-quinone reductase subunit F [Flavobacteriaceae bacterium]|nr:Na(+)-translocating NADH-quinone reductase subunit F [Flavobacteriaceae bacterium]MDB4131351.1 Na(+)-translocating NADH-quinone reductase subunit F [Flavobacteriaceae bacterium]